MQDPRNECQVFLGPRSGTLSLVRGAPGDPAKYLSRLSFEARTAAAADIREKHLQLPPELFGNRRLRLMLVNHASTGRFKARGKGTGRFRQISVDYASHVGWLESKDPRLNQEKKL